MGLDNVYGLVRVQMFIVPQKRIVPTMISQQWSTRITKIS
jgi:hypothetical protein